MDTVVEQLLQRREGAVARGINQMHPVYIQRAENAVMYDVNNRRYIDFSGGIAALNSKQWSFAATIPVYVDGHQVAQTVNTINGQQASRG
mgnify:CR=1 FL=1